ncbi:MAG: flavodoxin family protein [Candidatus Accumulibacter sp.]|jgi:multimeric flavodoxin WrbA|nr:flavodoxin family protein [Accumulibacter sp.]
MNVLLINGSPHPKGCTHTALSEIEKVLQRHKIETTRFHIGRKAIHGCIACRKCQKTGKCVFQDNANVCADLIRKADALVVGSPVYYASANGALCALLDRVFFSAGQDFRNKPAAAIVSCRRGGASAAFDRLNKYFTISEMPVVSSQYWNSVHGNTPEEVAQDAEGMQVMRTLGRNMAALLENLKTGKSKIPSEKREARVMTNFIR